MCDGDADMGMMHLESLAATNLLLFHHKSSCVGEESSRGFAAKLQYYVFIVQSLSQKLVIHTITLIVETSSQDCTT
jgi:hypothetical protein